MAWVPIVDVRPYIHTGYWADGYTVDDEWTIILPVSDAGEDA